MTADEYIASIEALVNETMAAYEWKLTVVDGIAEGSAALDYKMGQARQAIADAITDPTPEFLDEYHRGLWGD